MSLSSLNLIGQTVFELETGNVNLDGQMDGQTKGQKTDKQTDRITPISKGLPSYDGDLSPCQVGIRLVKLFSS